MSKYWFRAPAATNHTGMHTKSVHSMEVRGRLREESQGVNLARTIGTVHGLSFRDTLHQ
jgi:hypothetical protein